MSDARSLQDVFAEALLAAAGMADIRRALTTCIRADRFVEGTLAAAMVDGTIARCVERLVRGRVGKHRRRLAVRLGMSLKGAT